MRSTDPNLVKIMRDGFKATARGLRHLERSVARLDVHAREDMAERRAWEKKADRRLAAIERSTGLSLKHDRFVTAAVEQTKQALVEAGKIDKPSGGYSKVTPQSSPRRGR